MLKRVGIDVDANRAIALGEDKSQPEPVEVKALETYLAMVTAACMEQDNSEDDEALHAG